MRGGKKDETGFRHIMTRVRNSVWGHLYPQVSFFKSNVP